MKKKRLILNFILVIALTFICCASRTGLCQISNIDDLMGVGNNNQDQVYDPSQANISETPTDSSVTYMNNLLISNTSDQPPEATLMESNLSQAMMLSMDMLVTQPVQDVIEAFLLNDYTLLEIAQILKGAGISLEEIFMGIVTAEGEHVLKDVIGALIEAEFNYVCIMNAVKPFRRRK